MDCQVTFIIAARNAAATIGETLDSVIRQTRPDWQAIVVDDGSADDTVKIAESRAARGRIQILRQAAAGVAAARNRGAGAAATPWLVFLDSDDLIREDYLTAMLALPAAADDEGPEAVYCSGQRMTPDGRLGSVERPPASEHLKRLRNGNVFYTHGVMISRQIFEALGGFDPRLATCEDWDLWIRLFRSGAKVLEVDRALTIYRIRPGSLSRNPPMLLACAKEVIGRAYGDLEQVSPFGGGPRRAALEAEMQVSIFYLAMWALGVSIGARQTHESLLDDVAIPVRVEFEPVCDCLVQGIAAGACGLTSDWPQLWPRSRDDIADRFALLSARRSNSTFWETCHTRLAAVAVQEGLMELAT